MPSPEVVQAVKVATEDMVVSWKILATVLGLAASGIGVLFGLVWQKMTVVADMVAGLDRKFVGHAAKTNARLVTAEDEISRLRDQNSSHGWHQSAHPMQP